jgi:arsenite methyltransferase
MTMDTEKIKRAVRDGYGKVARRERSSCCGPGSSCCGSGTAVQEAGSRIGYTRQDLTAVPEGANLGLGCGNPIALASLSPGEVVLDLGAGAGFDCFLAARRVGPGGRVIGVDMTPEMLERARENARKGGYSNVEFRLGEIEHLPVADSSVDVIISNCVINLVPDKRQAFSEAFRVLKPGGRLMISDTVLTQPLPEAVQRSIAAYVGCVSGAVTKDAYIALVRSAGFQEVGIVEETPFSIDCIEDDPIAQKIRGETGGVSKELENLVASIRITGVKPQ